MVANCCGRPVPLAHDGKIVLCHNVCPSKDRLILQKVKTIAYILSILCDQENGLYTLGLP